MKRKLFLIFGIPSLIVIILAFFITFHPKPHPAPVDVLVAISPAVQKNVKIQAQAIGTVEAAATVSVRSLVDGQLETVGFKDGDRVLRGQVLFTIDSRPFQAQLAQAQANLERDQAQLNNAINILARNGKLLKSGYVGKQDYDTYNTSVATLKATVAADKAALATATLQLEYCTIRAPFTGRAGEVLVQAGNLVKASDPNPLVVIKQISPITVKFSLPEQQLPVLQQQAAASVISVLAKAGKDGPVLARGQLSFIDNAVDPATGTIALKATFANTDHKLWPGQFITVQLPIQQIANAVLVPTRAVQNGQSGNYLYVVNEQSNVSYRTIEIGPEIEGDTIVEQGLKPGEHVVTDGQLNLNNGMKVRLR